MARKPNQPRLRFDLEKLRNPDVACTFQATIGEKFAPLIGLSDEDMDMDTMITTSGLSHPFLGMGPGPLELGKIASF